MRNIDTTWKALAPGMALVDRYQRELEARWREPLRQERDRRDRQARAVWAAEEAERVREHEAAVAAREAREVVRLERVAQERVAWAGRVSSARERLMTRARSSALVGVPALLILLAGTAIAGVNAVMALVVVGLLAASPALLAGVRLIALLLGDPARRLRPEPMVEAPAPAPLPGPEPTPSVDLDIVEQWWQELGIPEAPRDVDHGTPGVDRFFKRLARLPDDHIAMRELAVAPGLDVDAIVVGPTGLWLFEIKNWSGKVICRDGAWERHTYYSSGDFRESEPIPDRERFDRQWVREVNAVEKTLGLRLSPTVRVPQASGGIVFSLPGVRWDLDDSCEAYYGDVPSWIDAIRDASEMEDFPLASQLAILDALVKFAHRLDDRLADGGNDAVALAKRLREEAIAAARDYVATSEDAAAS